MEARTAPLRLCAYEDRPIAMDSLALMSASLCSVDREIELHLTVPDAPDFIRALARRWPQVVLSTERPEGVTGWDVKPWLLLQQLNQGCPEAVWIDDDIIVTRPVSRLVREFPAGLLLFADEWGRWTIPASQYWGLTSARPVQLFNNCFIRVTQAHRPLLERWLQMTRDPRYRQAQALAYEERPVEAQHDGWLLVALLESEEFSHLPFACIRSGRHIAQCAGSSGYQPHHRVLGLIRGLPPLIHGLGRKPWGVNSETRPVQRFLLDLATDVSPYVLAAQRTARENDLHPDWLKPRTRLGAFLRGLTGGHPALAGLPLASVHALAVSLRRMMGARE